MGGGYEGHEKGEEGQRRRRCRGRRAGDEEEAGRDEGCHEEGGHEEGRHEEGGHEEEGLRGVSLALRACESSDLRQQRPSWFVHGALACCRRRLEGRPCRADSR